MEHWYLYPECTFNLLYWSIADLQYCINFHCRANWLSHIFSSVLFSHSVTSNSLRPHGLQHARLPYPSLSQSLLKLMSTESVMPSNHLILCLPFSSCPQFFPTSWSFSGSWLFTSGGQSIGASASASVLPMNIHSWFPLGLTGLISLLYKGL